VSARSTAAAYIEACLGELDALKPGNVHRYAAGHGMSVADFVRSAEASAGAIAASGSRVGLRVRRAVEATLAAVGQNTNLGIVLLCAPLAAAQETPGTALRVALARVLERLDEADAADVFAAIAAANPGGLGRAARYDVREPARVTLREAMQEAAGRDRIARQYVTGFEDVFEIGLPAFLRARAGGGPSSGAALAVYLAYVAAFPDTHIARKFGSDIAEAVLREAAPWRDASANGQGAEALIEKLLAWDASLKSRGLNPGTSADLTVATLFAASLAAARGEHLALPPQ
jgi:triphosphoribosyl-dephospho-CoA synthase